MLGLDRGIMRHHAAYVVPVTLDRKPHKDCAKAGRLKVKILTIITRIKCTTQFQAPAMRTGNEMAHKKRSSCLPGVGRITIPKRRICTMRRACPAEQYSPISMQRCGDHGPE